MFLFFFQNDQIQLVVLLERLLERVTLATATLTQLDNCYSFSSKNAEVCVILFDRYFFYSLSHTLKCIHLENYSLDLSNLRPFSQSYARCWSLRI